MNETVELRLTREQCLTILKYAEVPERLSTRLTAESGKTRIIPFTLDELDELLDIAHDAVYPAKGNERQKVLRIVAKISKLLGSDISSAPRPKVSRAKSRKEVFQIKITLNNIYPPIWRRILTKDCTLAQLHEVVQVAMGWEFGHPYEFMIRGRAYGEFADPYDESARDATRARLSGLLPVMSRRPRFTYHYDFGDDWIHQLIVEERFVPEDDTTQYPICIAGKRACPPEDSGGPYGYYQKLEILADPTNEERDELVEWMGEDFDPERFDREAVNDELKRVQEYRVKHLYKHDYIGEPLVLVVEDDWEDMPQQEDGTLELTNKNTAPVTVESTATPPAELEQAHRPIRVESRVGRNAPCPCNSGKKFKHCCMRKPVESESSAATDSR